jgi:hypothetical protein
MKVIPTTNDFSMWSVQLDSDDHEPMGKSIDSWPADPDGTIGIVESQISETR